MDATKLMLWLKWKKEENMHVFIADENGHVDETLSSLDSVNLKDYAIKVGLELVQEDEYSDSETAKGFSPEVLRIHIIDSGVGMDLKNHKVILFPFNKDIYSLLKKLFLNSNIPDGADIENAKI